MSNGSRSCAVDFAISGPESIHGRYLAPAVTPPARLRASGPCCAPSPPDAPITHRDRRLARRSSQPKPATPLVICHRTFVIFHRPQPGTAGLAIQGMIDDHERADQDPDLRRGGAALGR